MITTIVVSYCVGHVSGAVVDRNRATIAAYLKAQLVKLWKRITA
jgi:hypothetical protein